MIERIASPVFGVETPGFRICSTFHSICKMYRFLRLFRTLHCHNFCGPWLAMFCAPILESQLQSHANRVQQFLCQRELMEQDVS